MMSLYAGRRHLGRGATRARPVCRLRRGTPNLSKSGTATPIQPHQDLHTHKLQMRLPRQQNHSHLVPNHPRPTLSVDSAHVRICVLPASAPNPCLASGLASGHVSPPPLPAALTTPLPPPAAPTPPPPPTPAPPPAPACDAAAPLRLGMGLASLNEPPRLGMGLACLNEPPDCFASRPRLSHWHPASPLLLS